MADEAEPKAPPPGDPTFPVARDQNFRIVFANHSRMRLSPTEIMLTFGLVDQLPGTPSPFIQEQVTLALTPHHAKILAISLTETIKLFEAQYGQIQTVLPTTSLDLDKLRAGIAAETTKEK